MLVLPRVDVVFFFKGYGDHRDLPSFPTRRSSDLDRRAALGAGGAAGGRGVPRRAGARRRAGGRPRAARRRDRKSTRLNSSHANISYAVFCLKKKKKQ